MASSEYSVSASFLAAPTHTNIVGRRREIIHPTKYLPGIERMMGSALTPAAESPKDFLAKDMGITHKLWFLRRQ
jgi:hypothetical protein